LRRGGRAIAGGFVAIVFIMPLAFMVLASLRFPGLPPPDGFELIPDNPTFSNYDFIFLIVPLAKQIRNSLLVVSVAVPVTVLVASMAGFAIVHATPKVRRLLILLTVGAMMVPVSALWVPRFILFKWAGFTDGLFPLMAPALMGTAPFYILIFALAYSRLPRHIFEAAQLDGCSPLRMWWKVGVPLVKPATFAVAVLAFVTHWSNFVDALIYLTSAQFHTLPLGLRQLQTLEPQNFPILLAASVVATLPAVVAFLAAQRAFFTKTLDL
jgi:multiple sugar transport system permease protein